MENLCAAIPMADASYILSGQEFQKMLSSWLEEKGVLSDLRSQLRFKMVNALKDTAIGKDINKSNFHRMSLSKQAINVIVAEFLMRNKCYYSLSVFNTEVSLTHVLPDFPIVFDNDKMLNEVHRLDKENILNILELIGIVKASIYCEEVLTLYFNEEAHNSLLSCIISLLCKLINRNDRLCNLDLDVNILDLNIEDNFIKQIGNILNLSGLADKSLKSALEHIKTLYEIERKGIEEEYSRLINDLKIEINNQEKQTREMFKANNVLKNHLSKMTKNYKKLKLHTRNVIFHEKILRGNQAQGLKNNNAGLSSTLRNNLKENVSNSSDVIKKQNNGVCQLEHCSESCKNNKTIIIQNRNLIQENELQRKQITTLTLKYKQLISEFSECQQKICLLNSKLSGHSEELMLNVLYGDTPASSVNLEKNIDVSDVSSDNITEDILHETRLRLKQLEEETKTIEEKCKWLHLNTVV